MDQNKIERVLKIMKLLTGNVKYTIEELADRLEMSPRTIYLTKSIDSRMPTAGNTR